MGKKYGMNKLTDDKKTCQNYSLWCDHCQLFTVFWNQGETTFLWREKSLNNYILKSKSCFYDNTDS